MLAARLNLATIPLEYFCVKIPTVFHLLYPFLNKKSFKIIYKSFYQAVYRINKAFRDKYDM